MKEEITLRTISLKIILLSFVSLLLFLSLLLKLTEIVHIKNQTGFIICLGGFAGVVCNAIIYKNSNLVTFSFHDEFLSLYKKKKPQNIPYTEINNYNIYHFSAKNMGYIIRIKSDKNYLFWVTWKNFYKKQPVDEENNIEIIKLLNETLKEKKKKEPIDYTVSLMGWIPVLALIMAVLFLSGIFYYIFFIIK